jgi:toxin ParE1/3/4
MSVSLIWNPDAQEDLMEIYFPVALKNRSAADRLYRSIKERALLLTEHPRLGQRRPELAPQARVLVCGSYLILYETHPDTDEGDIDQVELVRVVHGSRDLSRVY